MANEYKAVCLTENDLRTGWSTDGGKIVKLGREHQREFSDHKVKIRVRKAGNRQGIVDDFLEFTINDFIIKYNINV